MKKDLFPGSSQIKITMLQERKINGYNGGKSGNGTYQAIINLIPKVHIYVEAMIGGGGIFWRLRLPALTVINDIDMMIMDKYKHLSSAAVIVKNINAMAIIDEYGYRGYNTLIYLDPPYLKSTRKSQQDLYKFEMTLSDHKELLAKIKTCTSQIMISHYPNELYDHELKNWNNITFQSITRKGTRTEKVYFNYDPPVRLQDYRYIGKNFTERQTIKRKIYRLKRKLQKMNDVERNANLEMITTTKFL